MSPAGNEGPSTACLLAIESSCDETAAAVVDRDLCVLSNVVASQSDLHVRYGGVVPEIASRAHVARILPVIDRALKVAGVELKDLSAIAVVTHPGLVGSLLVGLTAAKTLAATLQIPLVAVNHVEAHLYACRMSAGPEVFPAIGLVVSGGHSNLYDCDGEGFHLLGSTRDDAAGEAFDKVAKILELPYPGGPSISKAAESGNPRALDFPRSVLEENSLDFSFSGLKTAVLYAARGQPGSRAGSVELNASRLADIAASFQEAVVDIIVIKCRRALEQCNRPTLCIGGGVAANKRLRERLGELCREMGVRLVLAPPELCTDNAAMAAIAWEQLGRGQTAALDVDVTPGNIRRATN